jgi:hypothetical protein
MYQAFVTRFLLSTNTVMDRDLTSFCGRWFSEGRSDWVSDEDDAGAACASVVVAYGFPCASPTTTSGIRLTILCVYTTSDARSGGNQIAIVY